MSMNTTKRWFVYAALLVITLFLVWRSPESEFSPATIVQPIHNATHSVSVKPDLSTDSGVIDSISGLSPRGQAQEEIVVNLFETFTKKPIQVQTKIETTPTPVIKPSAPKLPFKYIGKLVEDNETKVFLLEGQALHIVKQGDKLGNKYQLKAIEDQQLIWVYLPMSITQKMSIGSTP